MARRDLRDDSARVFVKIAVRVEEFKRSIKLSFPSHLPYADDLSRITARLTAQGP